MSEPKTANLGELSAAEIGMLRELLQKANVPVPHAKTAAGLFDKLQNAEKLVKDGPAAP